MDITYDILYTISFVDKHNKKKSPKRIPILMRTSSKNPFSSQTLSLLDKLQELKRSLSNLSESPKLSAQNALGLFKNNSSSTDCMSTDSEGDKSVDFQQKKEQIRSQVIGLRTCFKSPFGLDLQSIYADHTATNRPYASIQKLIQNSKKLIANPHTEFNYFGQYTTKMMNYSQKSLLKTFQADQKEYVALPTGSGCTGAIEKTIKILELRTILKKATVYLTPYEHHSNILPWVQFCKNVVELPSNENGDLLMDEIQKSLLEDQSEYIILTISATSNVTSKLTNLSAINKIVKKVREIKKIIFCVDCAAYSPHKLFSFKKYDQTDFIFLSPHKNLGGAETCGVLIGRKEIADLSKPTFPGGGTVKFVKGYNKDDIMYQDSIFARQISGTPSFLAFYRAALSFQLLKEQITYQFIQDSELKNTSYFTELIDKANNRLKKQKRDTFIVLYGDSNPENRGNVITFNIISKKKVVNHNLVSQLLSDLFGIQLRSGCFCAGPFGIKLLNLSSQTISQLETEVSIGILKNKPGYCRLDLAFYFTNEEVEYIARALELICIYSHHINVFYTHCNDGDIKRLPILKSEEFEFSLSSLQGNETPNHTNTKFASNRQKILKKQILHAEEILQFPIKFLKTITK